MNPKLKTIEVATAELVPYAGNAKEHPEWQVGQIVQSIKEFGFNDPIGAWHNKDGKPVIVEGHGRLLAAQELGMDKVPVVFLDHLDDEGRRAYTLVHNQTTMNTGFDEVVLNAELSALPSFNMDDFGLGSIDDWFSGRERNDTSRQEGNDEYNEFLDKFELAKTTDDCYTPDIVYDAVANWVAAEYGVERDTFVRPFYPGGDYENEKYPAGCVVVDNPPFSILTQILRFYCEHNVKFFLFAPALTLFSSGSGLDLCYLATGVGITYENNANVSTSFITNLRTDNYIQSAPELYKAVDAANREACDERRELHLKYDYPTSVLTSSRVQYWSKYGVEFSVSRGDVQKIAALDAMKEQGKGIFGSGFLISEKAREEAEKAREEAEKAREEAEKAREEEAARRAFEAARALGDDVEISENGSVVWKLSDREKNIVRQLGR